MVIEVKTLAMANLAVQILLIIIVSGAAYLAKKRELGRHCMTMRIAVPIQIIAIASVMLPSLLGYLEHGTPGIFFKGEMLAHHTLGLAVIALWTYINLVFLGVAKLRVKLVTVMRLSFTLWVFALLSGLYLYVRIWVGQV
ncbi:MAG: hypothetical protein OIN66_15990 [Candidatus Methanoperedens sp.]|nr:hypothetical protein [Candidatus Methanoperedens sp.]